MCCGREEGCGSGVGSESGCVVEGRRVVGVGWVLRMGGLWVK